MDAKTTEAVELLRRLIATPSTSRDESRTADLLFAFLEERGAAPERLHNNVFARSADFDPARPTLLLNSHHDTVRPAASYTRDPFAPTAGHRGRPALRAWQQRRRSFGRVARPDVPDLP